LANANTLIAMARNDEVDRCGLSLSAELLAKEIRRRAEKFFNYDWHNEGDGLP
jgi:hypothetical protein